MRIFYFSGATLPSQSAQSVHVMKMCEAFSDISKKNSVTLFAKGARSAQDEDIFKYYGVKQTFSLVISENSKIRILSGIFRFFGHSWAMQEHGNPDLAYGRDPVELAYIVPENIPVVFEAHQVPSSFLQQLALNNLIKRRSLRAVIVISEALKDDLIKAFPKLKKSRIFVAPDGANIQENLDQSVELPGRKDVLRVGYTGSLHEGKGMEVLVVLARECLDFDFHVVGGSKEQVNDWQKRNLPENLYMHGHMPHKDLPPWLNSFDITIAPYRQKVKIKNGTDISRWISPLKIFEYMAARKPIISSDLPVIREVLKGGENALLVLPSDIKGWVAALENLKDNNLRQMLARNAYAEFEYKYTWQQRARNILKFVDSSV